MHFHLPKPLHGWREFAGEVGIIVVGILIALAGEQVVEHLRAEAQLRETEDAMRVELRDGDLPRAFARAAIHDCLAAHLDGIDNAVASGDRTKVLALARSYAPVFRPWDDEAWKAALTSPAFIQSGTKAMIGWSTAYGPMPVLMQQATEEQANLPQLRAKLSGSRRLLPAQQDRLFQVIAVLRGDNARMTGGSTAFMHFAGEMGLTLSEQEKAHILAEARQKYGACVKTPAAGAGDFSGYYSTARPRD